MPASNIKSVTVDGENVIIEGELDQDDYYVGLLHVWLAQPKQAAESGTPPVGAGLAIDCKSGGCELDHRHSFTLTAKNAVVSEGDIQELAAEDDENSTAAKSTAAKGVVGAFSAGPATASAIAVLIPKDGPAVPEVLQWSQIITVTEG
jgi:hypothetical protein